MVLFAPDADIVFIGSETGETAIGPDALKIRLKAIFSRPESYSWEWKWRSVSAEGSVAWVTADAVVRAKGGERDLALPYRLTVVMEKRGDRWLWMQYYGSEPRLILATTPVPFIPASMNTIVITPLFDRISETHREYAASDYELIASNPRADAGRMDRRSYMVEWWSRQRHVECRKHESWRVNTRLSEHRRVRQNKA